MAMMQILCSCLSVCVILQIRLPMASGIDGNVSQTVQSSNPSVVQTSFSTHSEPVLENQTSSTLNTSPLFTDELSSTPVNSVNLLSVTTSADNDVVASYSVTITSPVATSSSSNSSSVSVNETVETNNDYRSSDISMSTTSSVQSGIYSTFTEAELFPTSAAVSPVVTQETHFMVVNSTFIDKTIDALDASSAYIATDMPTTSDADVAVTKSTGEHWSDSDTDGSIVQSSVSDYSSSELHAQIPELSTSITITPILSEMINTNTTSTENTADVIIALTSSPALSPLKSTSVFRAEIIQSTPSSSQIEISNQSTPSSSQIEMSNQSWPSLSQTEISNQATPSLSQTEISNQSTPLLSQTEMDVSSTTIIVLPSDYLRGTINNSNGVVPTSVVSFNDSLSTNYDYLDTNETEFSSSIVPSSSETVTSPGGLLTLNTTSSVPEVYPSVQSTMSSSVFEVTRELVSTVSVSTGTPTLNVSDINISESLFISNTVRSIEMNSLYPSTQSMESYDSSSDLSGAPVASSSKDTLSSASVSVVRASVSITTLRSSSMPTSISPSSSSSFVTSEKNDGSHVSVSASSANTTTMSMVLDTSSEDSTNATGPEERFLTRVMITFNGDCHLIRDNILLQEEFLKAWVKDIESSTGLVIDTEEFKLEEMLCDPFRIIVHLVVHDSLLSSSVQQDFVSSSFNVRIPDSVSELNFSSTRVEILDDIKVTDGSDDMVGVGHLDVADIVIIGVASFLFAVLVVMLCGLLCRECYKRKRSSSFNLSDIPHINLKLSDFTLTKIPRPKVFYRENSKRKADRVPVTRVGPMSRHVDVPDVEDHYDKLNVNADKIQVRMRDHAHGLVVGVMCSKHARGMENDTSISDETTRSENLSKKSLLKDDECIPCKGINNPTFSTYDEEVNGNTKFADEEEEVEHFL